MNELAQQFRDAAARLDRFDTGKATAGLLDAEQKSPDAVAEGRQAGEALGMPAPIADLAPEEAAKRARIKQYRQALDSSPRLKAWIAEKGNAAVAHDDVDSLSWWERAGGFAQSMAAAVPETVGTGLRGVGRVNEFADPVMTIPPEERKTTAAQRLGREFDRLHTARQTFGREVLQPVGEALERFGQSIDVAPEERTLGNDIAGAFGQLAGQAALFFAGPSGAAVNLTLMFGQGVEQQRRLLEENGVDPNSREGQAAQIAGGIVTLATEQVGLSVLLKRLPALRNRVAALAASTVRGALAEGTQEVTESIAQQAIANAITEGDQELVGEVWREFVVGGSAGGLVALLRGALVPGRRQRVSRNTTPSEEEAQSPSPADGVANRDPIQQGDADTLRAINENAKASRLARRSPRDFEGYVEEATKGGDRDTVYVPAEEMVTYFQRSGRPEDIATSLGLDYGQVVEAATAGTRVAIPTSAYAARIAGGEHGDWFAEHGSFTDIGRTQADEANEAVATAMRAEAEDLQAEIDRELELRAGDVQIAETVAREFSSAGVAPQVSRQVAEAIAAFFRTTGQRIGDDPLELFRRVGGLRVRGELVERLNQVSRDQLDKIIDLARAGRTTSTAKRDDSLIPFLRRLGLREESGELAAIGAERLIRREGVPLEDAAVRAAEAGYLPDLAAELDSDAAPTLNRRQVLLDAIDKELRGKPVRVPDAAADEADAQAAAVEDLIQVAAQLGIDLQEASNADVKRQLVSETDARRFDDTAGKILRGYLMTPASGLQPDSPATVFLTKGYDLSTALHETGHYFLEVELAILESGQEAPAIKENIAALRRWWKGQAGSIAKEAGEGITADEVRAFLDVPSLIAETPRERAIWRAMHEHFARGFERYLFEGRAPSLRMQEVFRRFKAWLLLVYRQVRRLGVAIDDDAKAVFDRMLATDEEIQEAAELSGKLVEVDAPELAYMTDAQREEYRKRTTEALERGREEVLVELLGELQKSQSAEYKAILAETRAAAEEIVSSRPVHRAVEWFANRRWLGPGQPSNLPDLRLSKQWLIEQGYAGNLRSPANRKAGNAILPPVYAEKDGADPDLVAGFFGFRSGDQMVQAMLEAPTRADAVAEQTDAMMRERVGDMLRDGRLEEAALAAVHGEPYASVIEAEIRALASDRPSILPAVKKAAAAQATQMSENWTPRQARPGMYLWAERRAAEASRRALQRGNRIEALRQKERQLLNHHLWREAKRLTEELDKLRRQVGRYSKKGTREAIGPDYVDQIDALLERYDFHRISRRDEQFRESLLDFVARMEAEGRGHEVDIDPRIIRAAGRKSFNQTPVSELLALGDALKNLEHLGRLKTRLLLEHEQRNLEEVVDKVETSILDHGTPAPVRIGRGSPRDQAMKAVREGVNLVLNPDTILRTLDGGQEFGPAFEHLKRPIDRAINNLIPLEEKIAADLDQIFAVYGSGERHAMERRRRELPGLPAAMTKNQMLAVALNWGNESSREALLDGGPFTESQVEQILDQLDERDWKVVQAVWDYVDSFWPRIAELERMRKGKAPEKVQGVSVETRFGTMRGGYYPLKYDGGQSTKVSDEDVQDLSRQLLAGRFSKAQTARGHTIERTGSGGRPVLLDLGVLHGHLKRVAYDLSMGEAVHYVNRVLQHKRVRRALEQTGRQDTWRTLDLWVKDVAAGDTPASEIFERMARKVRVGLSVSALGWNVSTALLQPLGLLQTSVVLGQRHTFRGVLKLATSPWQGPQSVFRQIYDLSPVMRSRTEAFNKDIAASLSDLKKARYVPTWLTESFFYMISRTQQVVDAATWLGAYGRGQEDFDGDLEKARDFADGVVKRAQASPLLSDRSGLERGTTGNRFKQSELIRTTFTTMASYLYAKSNVAYERTRDTDFRNPKQVAAWAADMALLFVVETMAVMALRGQWPDEDDEESVAGRVAKESLNTALSGVPVVRDFVSEVQGFRGGGAFAAFYEVAGRVIAETTDDDASLQDFKAINNAGGVLLGYPSRQINRTLDALIRDLDGEDVAPIDYLMWREK